MCRTSSKSLFFSLTGLSTTNNYCRVFLHSGGGRISGAFMTYFLTNLTAIKINFKILKLPNYSRIFWELRIRRTFWRKYGVFNNNVMKLSWFHVTLSVSSFCRSSRYLVTKVLKGLMNLLFKRGTFSGSVWFIACTVLLYNNGPLYVKLWSELCNRL